MNETQEAPTAEEWVQVGHYPSLAQAYDHGLVILAMGEACRVEAAAAQGGFELHAEAVPATKISEELDVYGKEITAPEQESPAVPLHSTGWKFFGVWAILLMAVFQWQDRDSSLVDRAASSSAGIFDRGEWWRPFTGLFLHADVPHLAGNLAGGMVFASLVSKSIGPARAWALILTCGTVGNLLTARLHYPEAFLSIGASTAVFAALGILSGLGISETLRDRARLPWARITAPVLAGLVMLAWLGGASSPNTDVMGHMLGFSSGVVAGAVVGSIADAPRSA